MDLLVLCLLSVVGFVSSKNTYIATVPRYIRPGEDAEVCISAIRRVTKSVTIALTLLGKNNTVVQSSKSKKFIRKRPVTVNMKVPLNIGQNEYSLRVKASGGLNFDKTARDINVKWKSSSIFIQTDKKAYRPGDLVQYRVFGTDSNLNVLKDPINIFISDPNDNTVQQHLKVQPSYGLYTESFQLSTLTTLGNWYIQVKQRKETTYKSFTVEQFVLPRFYVSLILASFQLTTERFFRIGIITKYTFGKPVQGDCKLRIKQRWNDKEGIIKKFKINGTVKVKVLMSDVYKLGSSLEVIATVTESISGISAKDTKNTELHTTPEKLKFSSSMADTFKPKLPYNIILRVTQHDDSSLKPPLGRVNITVTYKLPKPTQPPGSHQDSSASLPTPVSSSPTLLWSRNIQIPDSRIITTKAVFPVRAVSADIEANYRKASTSKYPDKARSPSNNFIQVSIIKDQKAVPNKTLPLKIQTTQRNIPFVYYKVVSKGGLVANGRFRLRRGNGKVNLRVTYAMTPTAKLLVYYTRQNGEIIADAITFHIDDIFRTKVDIRFDKRKALPGEDVTLNIKSTARSLVNVLAIDKSVMLFKTGNDITVLDVIKELQRYGSGYSPVSRSWDYWFPRPVDGVDAYSIFRGFGVHVLTDAILYKYIPPPQPFGPGGFMAFYDAPGAFAGGTLAAPTRTRKNFPETWLWANVTTGSSGKTIIKTKAPDTITEWITSAFAVNPTTGLGVASELANLTTFQRFFMRFDLPYSAIRGEQIIVQISVFNYLDKEQRVVVTIKSSKEFIFVDTNGDEKTPVSGGLSKSITVKSDDVGAVYIPIQATSIGKIKLEASARSTAAADAVEKDFLIEAEGIKQSYNVPLLIDLRSKSNFKSKINIDFPPNLVKDSEFIKLQVFGDLLGPTLHGIDDLLKKSYGSGEANLVSFSTSVYVSTYLRATGRLTPALEEKSKRVLAAGYQRELSYSHDDGSYSAFGKNDENGTIWLTSYVIKSFAQASKFTFIDTNVMTKAIKWVIKRQKSTGAFEEPGKVLHKAMQGGSASSERSLACFVLIALEEARRNDQVDPEITALVQTARNRAIRFIATGAPATIGNLYELAITFYALSLVEHPMASILLFELEKKAKSSVGRKYWKLAVPVATKLQPWRRWIPPTKTVRAIDVETTSYVLLGYNIKADTPNGIKVLRWLGNQRNPSGGFISTQDTVIALQALSGLGVKLFTKTLSMNINTQAVTWTGRTFTIDDKNALVFQSEDLPKTVRYVSIDANGHGLCLLEAVVYYNVYEELREPAFNLTPTTLKETISGFTLRVCFRWLLDGNSTMGLLEISIPSGMEADTDSVDTSGAQGQFTFIEKAFRQVNLFFNAILSTEMCIEINIIRTSMVAKHKPQSIRLSEYYEPSNEVIKTYISTKLANSTIIEICRPENCEAVKKSSQVRKNIYGDIFMKEHISQTSYVDGYGNFYKFSINYDNQILPQ